MKYRTLIPLLLVLMLLPACDSVLDTAPLDQPSDQTFFSNADELQLAVNAIYKNLSFTVNNMPFEANLDAMSDIMWDRQDWDGMQVVGMGAHDSQTGVIRNAWSNYYRGISKANNLIDNMSRAQASTLPATYDRIEGEARFLRAFFYHRLVALYGDVPLVTKVQSLDDAMVSRTSKKEVIDFILSELDLAAAKLPATMSSADKGRATRGAALALKARVALYDGRYAVAAEAAKAVMALNVYKLNPDYQKLFTYAGEGNAEFILSFPYLTGVQTHALPQNILTRNQSGWSTMIPTQALVDSYEMIDGLPIDKSPLYDPANPFKDRDPRLGMTIVLPGTRLGDYKFETHPDSTKTWNYTTNSRVENKDVTNPYASFSGYCWRKYVDESDFKRINLSELDFPLMRYAEVLLTFAEAKIELNQLDDEMFTALDAVRRRAGMPAVSRSLTQSELRDVVRRERKVELAFEGLRLFDIRRWKTAEYVMPGALVGRPKGSYTAAYKPTFNAAGAPDYSAYKDKLRFIEERKFNPARDYLWPIPQSELDVNDMLTQNPGY